MQHLKHTHTRKFSFVYLKLKFDCVPRVFLLQNLAILGRGVMETKNLNSDEKR